MPVFLDPLLTHVLEKELWERRLEKRENIPLETVTRKKYFILKGVPEITHNFEI